MFFGKKIISKCKNTKQWIYLHKICYNRDEYSSGLVVLLTLKHIP